MAKIDTLIYELGIDEKDFKRALEAAEINFKQFQKTVEQSGDKLKVNADTDPFHKSLQNAENKFKDFTKNIIKMAGSIVIGAGIASQMKDAVNSFTSFEEAMKQVATLSDASDEELRQVEDTLLEIAKAGDFSATELANAYYQALSAVGDTTEAMAVLQEANKAAIGGNADLFQSVDGLTSMYNAWKLSIDDLAKTNDLLFTAVRMGKTTVDEIAGSIGRVAPLAAQAGVGIDEVLTAVAALTLQGSSTAEAMTQLRGIFSSMTKPSEQAKKMAEELGIQFDVTALKSKGLQGVLNDIAEATEGDSAKMAMLFGEVEALNGVLALTGKGVEDFENILSEMGVSVGATDEAVAKMETGLKDTLDRLTGLIDVMKIEAARTFAPFIENVANITIGFLEWIQNMNDSEKAILGVSGALIVIIPLIKQMYTWITLARTATMGWVGALQAIAGVTIAVTTIKGINDEMEKLEQTTSSTAKSAEDFTDSFKFDSKAVSDVSNEMRAISSEIERARREAKNLDNALKNLQGAIIDYNRALENGTGNLDESKQRIEDILYTYPSLQKAVEIVNDRYTIQKEELQNILELEKQRLEAQLEALKNRREMLVWQMNSEYYQSQRKGIEENLKVTENALNQLKQDIDKVGSSFNELLQLSSGMSYLDMLGEASPLLKEIEKLAQEWGIDIEDTMKKVESGTVSIGEVVRVFTDELIQKQMDLEKQIFSSKEALNEFAAQEAEIKLLEIGIAGLENNIKSLEQTTKDVSEAVYETVKAENERIEQLKKDIEYQKELAKRYEYNEEKQAQALQDLIKLTENLRDEQVKQLREQNKSIDEQIDLYQSFDPILEDYQKQVENLGVATKKSLREIEKEIEDTQALLDREEISERRVDLLNEMISLTKNRMDLEMDLATTQEERFQIWEQSQNAIEKFENDIKALTEEEIVLENQRIEQLNKRIALMERNKRIYTQEEDQINYLNEIISLNQQMREEELKNAESLEEQGEIWDKYENILKPLRSELQELQKVEEAETKSTIDSIKADIEKWESRLKNAESIEDQIDATNNLISLTRRLKDEEDKIIEDSQKSFENWQMRNEQIREYEKQLEKLQQLEARNIDTIKEEIKAQELLLSQAETDRQRIDILNQMIGLYGRLRDAEMEAAESEEAAIAIYYEYDATLKSLEDTIEELSDTELRRVKTLESEFEKATGERKKLIAEELQSYYNRQAKLNLIDEAEFNRLMNYVSQYETYLESLENMEESYIEQAKSLLGVLEEHPEAIEELEIQITKIKIALEELNKIRNELESQELDTSEIDNFIEDLNEKLEETQNRIAEINQELEDLVKKQLEKGLQEVGDLLVSIGETLGQDWSFFADILREIPRYLEQIRIAQELMNISNPVGWIVLVIDLLERVISLVNIWNSGSLKSEQLSRAIAKQQREINEYVREKIDLNRVEETSLQRVWNQYQNNQKTVAEIEKAEDELTKMMEKRKKVLQEAKEEEDKWDFLWWGTDEERVEQLENEAAQLDEKIEEQKRKIEELKNELITSGEFASALGVGAEDIESDIISALENALSGTNTYEDFVQNFSQSMEESLRNAIIKAMVAKALQQQIDALVQMISESYSDAELTQEELEAIRAMYEALISQSESVYEDIKALGFDLGETGGGQGEYSGAAGISRTITEETANRMIDYLTTFLIHLQNIEKNTYETANVLKNGIIKVSIQESIGITIEEIKQAQGT
jgi:TP901 family phage tail tape measure protein